MKTIETIATITPNQELRIQLPENAPVGTFKIVLVIDDTPVSSPLKSEAIEEPVSFLEAAKDLIGCLDGLPPDLSTNKKIYGGIGSGMKRQVLLDTGIIVSLLSRQDQFHDWTTETVTGLDQPLLTCEAVITEACFLLRSAYGSQQAVFALFQQDMVRIPFCLADEVNRISELMARYENVPMSLADACLVRMAELNPDSLVLTLDSDFRIYRKHLNQEIPVLMPEER